MSTKSKESKGPKTKSDNGTAAGEANSGTDAHSHSTSTSHSGRPHHSPEFINSFNAAFVRATPPFLRRVFPIKLGLRRDTIAKRAAQMGLQVSLQMHFGSPMSYTPYAYLSQLAAARKHAWPTISLPELNITSTTVPFELDPDYYVTGEGAPRNDAGAVSFLPADRQLVGERRPRIANINRDCYILGDDAFPRTGVQGYLAHDGTEFLVDDLGCELIPGSDYYDLYIKGVPGDPSTAKEITVVVYRHGRIDGSEIEGTAVFVPDHAGTIQFFEHKSGPSIVSDFD